MWIRWRRAYGAGIWSRWHETATTEDNSPVLCGRDFPAERIESRERKPSEGLCLQCGRWDRSCGKPKRRAAGQGGTRPQTSR